MADITKLRCNVCQDFLKMIIKPNWREVVYKKAESEVMGNGRFKAKYAAAYERIRDIGIDRYSVDDMDVTFISEILTGCRGVATVTSQTYEAIRKLTEDRNVTNHSNENEDTEELYLRGLLSLIDLRSFVRTVDLTETTIPDTDRLAFRQEYIKKIEELKETIDDERIVLIQSQKRMKSDIKKILDSDDPRSIWCSVYKEYSYRAFKIDRDYSIFYDFQIMASDAGVKFAHGGAADFYFLIAKDYTEAERRLDMLFSACPQLETYDAHQIVRMANGFLSAGVELSPRMLEMIDSIIQQGFPVNKRPDGKLDWVSKAKKACEPPVTK